MKKMKIVLICAMVLAVIVMFAACGNKSVSSEESTAASTIVVQPEVIPSPDPAAGVDNLLGEWMDYNDKDRFAKITKIAQGYQYEDNEGQYPAEFKDGVLLVKVSDTDTAKVYFSASTQHMYCEFNGESIEYTKK